MTQRIIQTILPDWHDSRRWLDAAFRKAGKSEEISEIKVGGVRIAVQNSMPADIPGTYVAIIITTDTEGMNK